MELYTLDENFRRQEVIDSYESMIWTERFNEIGDFELDIQTTPRIKALLRTGTWLAMNESHRIMQVQTVTDTVDADHKQMLKVVGLSMEDILNQRYAGVGPYTVSETGVVPWGETGNNDGFEWWSDATTWKLVGYPAEICRTMFRNICMLGQMATADIYPFLNEGQDIYYPSTIPEPGQSLIYLAEPDSLFNAMKKVLDTYWLGFRIVRQVDQYSPNYDPIIGWDIYSGNDRTLGQTAFPAVVFSASLDTLQNTKEISDISDYKNVGLVHWDGSTLTFASYVDDGKESTGLDRRVIGQVSQANTDDPDNLSPAAQMFSAGKLLVGQHKKVYALDGEVNEYGSYKYGKDYDLGDRVEMRADDGLTQKMIVTEQIFVSDSEGERSYPTLTLETSVQPGTWLTYNNTAEWSTRSTTETWASEP